MSYMKQYQQSHPHLFEQIGEVLKTNSNFEDRLTVMGTIFQLLIVGGILFFLSILWEQLQQNTSDIPALLFIGFALIYALVKTIKKLLYYYEYAYVGTEGFLTLYMRRQPL